MFLFSAVLAAGTAWSGLSATGWTESAQVQSESNFLAPFLDELDARFAAIEFEARESEGRLAELTSVETPDQKTCHIDAGMPGGPGTRTGSCKLSVFFFSKSAAAAPQYNERSVDLRARPGDATGPAPVVFFAGVREYFAFRNGYARRRGPCSASPTLALAFRSHFFPHASVSRLVPFIFFGVRS